jgi:hypothetical protein
MLGVVADTGGYCGRWVLLLTLWIFAGTVGYWWYRSLLQIQGVIVDNTFYCWHRGLWIIAELLLASLVVDITGCR